MTIQETINYFIGQLEAIATVSINAIKSNIFKVSVGNFPKTQDVKGTVIVGNLKSEIKDLSKKIIAVESAIKSVQYPTEIVVKNIKDTPLQEKIVIPPYPTEISIKNQKEKIELSNIDIIVKELENVSKQIKKIELSPKIVVEPPQVNIEAQKPPIINIPEQERLFSSDPKQYIPVRLTDGEKFYEAITNLIGGLNRLKKVEVVNGNILATFETNDVDKVSATLLYNGLEEKDGAWCIQRVDSTTGVVVRFATSVNNSGIVGYEDAWTNRSSLNYDYFSEVF